MVVKNSDTAKEYLDLTETEFESLSKIAESFSMAKLSYHATLLEEALADMQRSQNSKRSVAEIALTRMCDSKLLATPEALALRIEELEKQISMIKMGAISVSAAPEARPAQQTQKPINQAAAAKPMPNQVKEAPLPTYAKPYALWNAVVDRISEFKPPLASGLRKAEAYTVGEYSYLIKLDAFFAERLNKSPSETAILKGAIAEKEGIAHENVRIKIDPIGNTVKNHASEIENALKF
jgi:DNA polymerase III gamma/tau subunit